MNRFTVAALQMTSTDDRDSNLKKTKRLLEKGLDRGAKLFALPENFSFMGKEEREKLELAETLEKGPSIDFLRNFASRNKVWIAGGTLPIMAGEGKVYNRSIVIDSDGSISAFYDKVHLFDVEIPGGERHKESDTVKGGDKAVTCETPFGVLGLTICYDLRFPELYRQLTAGGAKIIFVPAAFTKKTGEAHWEVLLRARAIENQIYIIAAAQHGKHNDERSTYGNSMIIDPWGKVLARAEDGERVITAEVDLDYLESVRSNIPCLEQRFFK